MARRYNPSRIGLSRGDAMPAEPYYPNVPTAPNMPAEDYNRALMPRCSKTGEDINLYTMHAMKQEEFLEKLDINVTKTDINIAKGQPIA
uniref:Uncharacterized protein n=1 Tax=Magallana gigas TaxID=29159 RepID=K1PKS2_MAGGI